MGIIPNDDPSFVLLIQAWSRMQDCIAHDITTPLVIASMGGDAVAKVLPDLIEGYRLALTHKLIEPNVGEQHLKLVEDHSIPSISSNIQWVLDFLRSIYDYKQQILTTSHQMRHHQILPCLTEIIEHYPFPDQKSRALVKIQCHHNFTFQYPSALVAPLFTNLLKNALSAVTHAGKGDIVIWTEEETHHHVIHFKETGSGMDENKVKHIFDQFFSQNEQTAAPGLGLCRLAALHCKGDILCSSVEGQFTDFTVKFARET